MRRFSIRNLMGLVFALAVAFASLRGANEYWSGGLVLGLLGLVGYSILAAIHGRALGRAGWLGFLILGGGYFLAVRALPSQESGWLPTSQLLSYVERQVVGLDLVRMSYMPLGTLNTSSFVLNPANSTTVLTTPGTPATVATTWSVPATINTTSNVTPLRLWNVSGTTTNSWAPILPGAANTEAFHSVGHVLFALFAGWLGAVLSRRMSAHHSQAPEMDKSPVAVERPNVL